MRKNHLFKRCGCVVFTLILGLASQALAEPIVWTGGAGNGQWSTAGNWNLNRVPTNTDAVTIDLPGTFTVTVAGSASAQTLTVGAPGSSPTLVLITLANLTVNGAMTVTPTATLEMQRHPVIGASFLTIGSGNSLINQGTFNATGAAGDIVLNGHVNNQGAINLLGPRLGVGGSSTITNSGTINLTGGDLGANPPGAALHLTNTGTITIGAGRTLSLNEGTINLTAGSVGGPGTLSTSNSNINLGADLHTADFGVLSLALGSVNGPGSVINDAPGGFAPSRVNFYAAVSNVTTLDADRGSFNGGFTNPAGATLRLRGDNNFSSVTFTSGFTNGGLIELVGRGHMVFVQGTLVNAPAGQIVVKQNGNGDGFRALMPYVLDNQGTITNQDVSVLQLGSGSFTINNSGTINVTGGNLSNASTFGAFTNTGNVIFAPGRSYSQSNGTTLNLNGGTFGGPGAILNLNNVIVNHTLDFHTADWSGLSISLCTFNGPGVFINDLPTAFQPTASTFYTLVDNRSLLEAYGSGQNSCYFAGGLLNPASATLRVIGDQNFSYCTIAGGFTNNGTVDVVGRGADLRVTGGTFLNNGSIVVRRAGYADGARVLEFSTLNNQGTITNLDVSDLRIGGGSATLALNNSGIINILHGSLSNHDGVNAANILTFTNTGQVNFSPGTLYRQRIGTLNLNSGTFGGIGVNINLREMVINHTAAFHTNAWTSIFIAGATFNGPGDFINDHPSGLEASNYNFVPCTFNTRVDNQTTLTAYSNTTFAGQVLNPPHATIRVFWQSIGSIDDACYMRQNFQNEGTVEFINRGAGLVVVGPPPLLEPRSFTNMPTGRVLVRTQSVGPGKCALNCRLVDNRGLFKIEDTSLSLGIPNDTHNIVNYGIFDIAGGNLDCVLSVLDTTTIANWGQFIVRQGRQITGLNRPFYQEGGSLTTYGNFTLDTSLIANGGVIRPGGPNAPGNLYITGVGRLVGATLEIDVGAPGPANHDVVAFDDDVNSFGESLMDSPVRVNIAGNNLPAPGASIQFCAGLLPVSHGPPNFGPANLTLSDGSVCIGWSGFPGNNAIEVMPIGNCTGPTITQQPQATGGGCLGDTLNVSVAASGSGTLSYQWKRNGSMLFNGTGLCGSTIAGATTSQLTITNMAAPDFAAYSVDVTDSSGTTASAPVNVPQTCVIVTDETTQAFLDGITTIVDSLLMIDEDTRPTLIVPNLTQVGGRVEVRDNDALTTIQASQLASIIGALKIKNNPLLTTLSMAALGNVGGDLEFTGNTNAPVDFSGLVTVGGSVKIESNSNVDLSGTAVGGNADVSTNGATSAEVQVPGGTTSVEMSKNGGRVKVDLPDDAAPAGTPFAVLHVSGAGLDPQPGLDATGAAAVVDPVVAYSFTLAGTLATPASLVYELVLAELTPGDQTAVLAAYAAGQLMLTVKSDAPGSLPQARPQCGPTDPLVADGCVKVGAFDALGFELPSGVTTGAVKIRIAALVSHFSTYAASIVTPPPVIPGDCNCSGALTVDDIGPFVLALTDPGAYAVAFPDCPITRADLDGNTTVDGQDIGVFVSALTLP